MAYLLLGGGEEQAWAKTNRDTDMYLQTDLTQTLKESQTMEKDLNTDLDYDVKKYTSLSGDNRQINKHSDL